MRKLVYAICKQQRCRPACVSAQSDQHHCCLLLDSIILTLAISKKIKTLAEQAGLSLTLSETPKTGFLWRGSYFIIVQCASIGYHNCCTMFAFIFLPGI